MRPTLRSNILLIPIAIVLASCGKGGAGEESPAKTKDAKTKDVKTKDAKAPDTNESTVAAHAFRNAVGTPASDWKGPVFELSHDYPSEKPKCSSPWLERNVDFDNPNPTWDEGWQGYVQDIVDYVKEGQEPDLPNDPGWRAAVGGETRWFHVPWMSYDGQRGREFVHGLTNELSTAKSSFIGRGSGTHTLPSANAPAGDGDPLFETWSVGFYNPCGGWSIGQQWPESGEPATYEDGGRLLARGMPFPEGTVVVKVLNTTASGDDVSYLKGSNTWQANGHAVTGPNEYATCERKVRDVHLVQMDLAVVDLRSPTRWVYSTLVYNGTLPGKTVWERMQPLGVQWGSDPDTFPAVSEAKSKPLHQSINAPIDIYEHYGCNKRLAGNVDQANSSCVSCHMGAYAAAPGVVVEQGTNVPPVFNFDGMCTTPNEGNTSYFSNYPYPEPFPNSTGEIAAAIPLDSSLQLQVAFAQFAYFKNPPTKPACPPAG